MMSEIPQERSRREAPGENGAVILRRCIETEADSLRGTLAVYLHRAWAMSHEEARERAHDVLAEVVTIALKKAPEFDSRRSPYAWLLGIGTRVVLQHRDALFAQRQREADPTPGAPWDSYGGDDPFFEELVALSSPDVAATV